MLSDKREQIMGMSNYVLENQEKLDNYIISEVSNCTNYEEFVQKVREYMIENRFEYIEEDLSEVWNEFWSKYQYDFSTCEVVEKC